MKVITFLFLFLLIVLHGKSQDDNIDSLVHLPETKLPYYEMSVSGSKVLYLPMEFGKSYFSINQRLALERLKNTDIAGVDLVYTDYPARVDFSVLNKKRLETLQRELPAVFSASNRKLQFRKIRQTMAGNKTDAQYMQHGFFIYYRPKADTASANREIKKIESILKDPATLTERTHPVYSHVTYCSEYSFYEDTAEYVHPLREGFVRSVTKIAVKDIFRDKLYEEKTFKQYYPGLKELDSVFYVYDLNKDSCDDYLGVYDYNAVDSTVSAVFKRHKWNSAIITADVTGSMYPYTAQLLLWLKLKTNNGLRQTFVFFNDGDLTPDDEKVIGKTGGIYTVTSSGYEEVERTVMKAMAAGCGGDSPENNLEAVLKAVALCNNCDSIVMIADNWAPVKDISLLDKINKPLKIVLCGVYGPVNPDYLNIARKTKGSLHLMERDIYDLSLLHEGEMIEISGHLYRISNGEFREVVKKLM